MNLKPVQGTKVRYIRRYMKAECMIMRLCCFSVVQVIVVYRGMQNGHLPLVVLNLYVAYLYVVCYLSSIFTLHIL